MPNSLGAQSLFLLLSDGVSDLGNAREVILLIGECLHEVFRSWALTAPRLVIAETLCSQARGGTFTSFTSKFLPFYWAQAGPCL